jgi:hypothetical protein
MDHGPHVPACTCRTRRRGRPPRHFRPPPALCSADGRWSWRRRQAPPRTVCPPYEAIALPARPTRGPSTAARIDRPMLSCRPSRLQTHKASTDPPPAPALHNEPQSNGGETYGSRWMPVFCIRTCHLLDCSHGSEPGGRDEARQSVGISDSDGTCRNTGATDFQSV